MPSRLSARTFARNRRACTGAPTAAATVASDAVVRRLRVLSSTWATASSCASVTARPIPRARASWTAGSSPRTTAPSGIAMTGTWPSNRAPNRNNPSMRSKRRLLLPLPHWPCGSRMAHSRSPGTPRPSTTVWAVALPYRDFTRYRRIERTVPTIEPSSGWALPPEGRSVCHKTPSFESDPPRCDKRIARHKFRVGLRAPVSGVRPKTCTRRRLRCPG